MEQSRNLGIHPHAHGHRVYDRIPVQDSQEMIILINGAGIIMYPYGEEKEKFYSYFATLIKFKSWWITNVNVKGKTMELLKII